MRYFVGFLITIGLIILLLVMLLGGSNNKSKVPKTIKTLADYAATSAEVRVTNDGPINAESQHQKIRITVNRDNVTYEQINGYDDGVVKMQNYPNTKDAYSTFLLALAHANFTKGDTAKALSDERGYCPLGNRYIFELIQDGKTLERFWSTSCGKPKTYLGNSSLTLTLFKAQVPDYSALTENQASGINNFSL